VIVVDNNILSTFARVGQFDLLFRLFPGDTLSIPPAVYDEIMVALRLGYPFLEVAREAVQAGHLHILPLTSAEVAAKPALPTSFGAGDAECVILSQRRDGPLLTNDHRVRNFCRAEGIVVFDLPQLLRALWANGVLSQSRVRALVDEMEVAEHMIIANKEAIFDR